MSAKQIERGTKSEATEPEFCQFWHNWVPDISTLVAQFSQNWVPEQMSWLYFSKHAPDIAKVVRITF